MEIPVFKFMPTVSHPVTGGHSEDSKEGNMQSLKREMSKSKKINGNQDSQTASFYTYY